MTHSQPNDGDSDVSDTYPTADPRDQAESVEAPSRSPESIAVPAEVPDCSGQKPIPTRRKVGVGILSGAWL